jgi:hypothetical protein
LQAIKKATKRPKSPPQVDEPPQASDLPEIHDQVPESASDGRPGIPYKAPLSVGGNLLGAAAGGGSPASEQVVAPLPSRRPGRFDGDLALVAARQKLERGIITQMEYRQIASTHNRGHLYEILARESVAIAPPTTDPRDADSPAVVIAQTLVHT